MCVQCPPHTYIYNIDGYKWMNAWMACVCVCIFHGKSPNLMLDAHKIYIFSSLIFFGEHDFSRSKWNVWKRNVMVSMMMTTTTMNLNQIYNIEAERYFLFSWSLGFSITDGNGGGDDGSKGATVNNRIIFHSETWISLSHIHKRAAKERQSATLSFYRVQKYWTNCFQQAILPKHSAHSIFFFLPSLYCYRARYSSFKQWAAFKCNIYICINVLARFMFHLIEMWTVFIHSLSLITHIHTLIYTHIILG